MNDVERALSQIADIHARVSASSRFQGLAPQAMGFTALLSLAAATAQTFWPERFGAAPLRYVAVWSAVMLVSMGVASVEAIYRARSLHGRMAEVLLGAALRQSIPFAAAAVVIVAAICRLSPDTAWVLPGVFQILVALAGFSLAPSLPGAIRWAAGWYFVCGAVVLGLGARSGALSPWMMGLPFAIGQAGVALILHRSNGASDAR